MHCEVADCKGTQRDVLRGGLSLLSAECYND